MSDARYPVPPQQHSFHTMPVEQLSDLLTRQYISTADATVARIVLRKGCMVPEHSHSNEQIAYVLEGALRFMVAGVEHVVRAGELLVLPPHVPHSAEALEDTVDLDIFTPPRLDWAAGDDAYLRGAKR